MGIEKRLLIADDNVEFANFCAKVARGEGWTVTLCKNGAELLEAIRGDDHPALVLCDINMPQVDAFEVIQDLRDTKRRLLFRFMTGGVPINAKAASFLGEEHGLSVRGYLLKPIGIDSLRATLALDVDGLAAL